MLKKNISPLHPQQEYIWFADYGNNQLVYEFDDDKKETSFYDIDQDKTQFFGLIGNGLRLSFNKETGTFILNNKEYPVSIQLNQTDINLKDQDKRLVHFKLGHTDAVIINRKINRYERNIDGYFFGYRFTYDQVYMQIIFGIPVAGADRRPFFGIKISSNISAKIQIQIGTKAQTLDITSNKTETTNIYIS